jgi:hypothetical protein
MSSSKPAAAAATAAVSDDDDDDDDDNVRRTQLEVEFDNIQANRDVIFQKIDAEIETLQDKIIALEEQKETALIAARSALLPLLKELEPFKVLDMINNTLAKLEAEPRTVFLFDTGGNNLVLEIGDAKDIEISKECKHVPRALKEAVAKLNAALVWATDVGISHRYDASASCCEDDDFGETLRVSYSGMKVEWEKLPKYCSDYKHDKTTAHTHEENGPKSDPEEMFEKGDFSGCGLDRLRATKYVKDEDVIVMVPRPPQPPPVAIAETGPGSKRKADTPLSAEHDKKSRSFPSD